MTEIELKARTRRFALDIVTLVDELPRVRVTDRFARQLLGSGTSVGSNYRAACRGRSDAERAAKLAIVEEEADESIFWMDSSVDSQRVPAARVTSLVGEADELIRIAVASIKRLRGKVSPRKIRETVLSYRAETQDDQDLLLSAPQSTIQNPQ